MGDELARYNHVYSYEFADPAPPTPDPLRTLPFPVGASHSLELRYLFAIGGAPPLSQAQQVLSDQMIDYWSNFVANGNPADGDQPEWPELGTDPTAENRLSLRPDGSRVEHDFDERHQCGFWANLKG
jgi:para-nitrobenzyl esterase